MLFTECMIDLGEAADMSALRHRIDGLGPRDDHHPGLVTKVFGLGEIGIHGATLNVYHAFYLWRSAESAKTYFVGDTFAGLIRRLGRPQVRSWLVLGYGHHMCPGHPAWATWETHPIEPAVELQAVCAAELDQQHWALSAEGVSYHIAVLNVESWRLGRLVVWDSSTVVPSLPAGGARYEVPRVARSTAQPGCAPAPVRAVPRG